MPQVLQSVYEIAHNEGRGVLYVTFNPIYSPDIDKNQYLESKYSDDSGFEIWDWDNCPKRRAFIQWLDLNGYFWVECDCTRHHSPTYLTYEGSIYINIGFNLHDPEYVKLQEKLERPDGKMKYPAVIL